MFGTSRVCLLFIVNYWLIRSNPHLSSSFKKIQKKCLFFIQLEYAYIPILVLLVDVFVFN